MHAAGQPVSVSHDPDRPIDSPFVRRVGIALTLYGLQFEHRHWSTFGDADKIGPHNPLTRVPTLVLDNGEVLIESHLMLDYLDGLVAADRRMFPTNEPARRQALKIAALRLGSATRPSACSTKNGCTRKSRIFGSTVAARK